ncbi:MAG TPA: ATP synthase F0 subunit C [Terriglobia bacterium]|nr:ATP synthase F0 subunit C [Terriglobia bacterium]
MRQKVLIFCTTITGLLLTAPLFGAQGAAAGAGGSSTNWVAITSGFAMAIASGLCGLGQGKAAASACEGLARNPGARPGIQFFLILALIFIESLALYTFGIIFIKVR